LVQKITLKFTRTIITSMSLAMLSACNNTSDNNKVIDNGTPISSISVVQSIFEDIDQVRNSLSSVGIGELGEWKEDGMGGYMSITSYYQIEGDNRSIPNNLAYYIESIQSDRIESIKLVFNLNNPKTKTSATEKYKDVALQTFKVLNIELPKDVQDAISNLKENSTKTDKVLISHSLQQSNITTWTLTIKPI